jgi:membrane dipeptidase
MREGNIGLCVATLIARYVKPKNKLPGWNSPEQAWAQTQGQLAWYRAMEEGQHLIQIKTPQDLTQHLSRWEENAVKTPIGYVLSLEGADSIISMDHLHRMHGVLHIMALEPMLLEQIPLEVLVFKEKRY